jgi:transposase
LGLALVVDQDTQLPLAHVLYEGSRSDMRTFAAFLKPVRERLHTLTSQPQPLTLVMWSAPLCRVFELAVDSAPE